MRKIAYAILGKPRPIIYRATVALGGGLTLAVLSVVLLSRMVGVPMSLDLPSYLLPGSPLPADTKCVEPIDDKPCYTRSYYSFLYSGRQVYLTYDPHSARIVRTVIAGHEYTLGDLVVAWGIPDGFAQNGRTIDIYWGARGAYLNTCLFRLDSHIERIIFYKEPYHGSPWRGFISSQCPYE
jgi:hypothetical protein